MYINNNIKDKNPLRVYADKLAKKKNKNDINNIIIDNFNTNIPVNLPTAIIGEKGSGKTTLIKSIVEMTNKKVFNNIFFIYSDISDNTVGDVIKIDVKDCLEFLSVYFASKSIYNSYIDFFKSLNFDKLQKLYNNGKLTEDDILLNVNNNIVKYNKDAFNKIDDPKLKIDNIIETGEKIIKKFSNTFYIGSYRINGFKPDDRDAVIIDDIAIAGKFLFTHIKDNIIYEYLTLTRHMRLFILFAGQQVEQIPKALRREIMAWILSKNTNIDLLNGVLNKDVIRRIQDKQQLIGRFEFVLYNTVDGIISTI